MKYRYIVEATKLDVQVLEQCSGRYVCPWITTITDELTCLISWTEMSFETPDNTSVIKTILQFLLKKPPTK